MFLHPDGRWRGRILHRSVALGSGEGEGPADQQDEAVPRTYLSEHPTEQAGDSWQNLIFPLADVPGTVSAGELLNSPGWKKGQDCLQMAVAPGCHALCPVIRFSA